MRVSVLAIENLKVCVYLMCSDFIIIYRVVHVHDFYCYILRSHLNSDVHVYYLIIDTVQILEIDIKCSGHSNSISSRTKVLRALNDNVALKHDKLCHQYSDSVPEPDSAFIEPEPENTRVSYVNYMDSKRFVVERRRCVKDWYCIILTISNCQSDVLLSSKTGSQRSYQSLWLGLGILLTTMCVAFVSCGMLVVKFCNKLCSYQ
jgi:hypothetical protein